jgi:DNA-binding HxlR family transcriptional regulator
MALGTGYDQQFCTIARALEILGERWTMLVLRDCFYGVRRFTHLLEHLDISRAVLTDRLNKLVEAGVLERRSVDEHPAYVLTDAGLATWPVLFALSQWGKTYAAGPGRSLDLTHAACGAEIDERGRCPRCSIIPEPADLVTIPSPGASRSPRTDPISLLLRQPHRMLTPLEP